jgi:hypothetical protein
MLGKEGLKSRQHTWLDFQLWMGRNAVWVFFTVTLLAVALTGAGYLLTASRYHESVLHPVEVGPAAHSELENEGWGGRKEVEWTQPGTGDEEKVVIDFVMERWG